MILCSLVALSVQAQTDDPRSAISGYTRLQYRDGKWSGDYWESQWFNYSFSDREFAVACGLQTFYTGHAAVVEYDVATDKFYYNRFECDTYNSTGDDNSDLIDQWVSPKWYHFRTSNPFQVVAVGRNKTWSFPDAPGPLGIFIDPILDEVDNALLYIAVYQRDPLEPIPTPTPTPLPAEPPGECTQYTMVPNEPRTLFVDANEKWRFASRDGHVGVRRVGDLDFLDVGFQVSEFPKLPVWNKYALYGDYEQTIVILDTPERDTLIVCPGVDLDPPDPPTATPTNTPPATPTADAGGCVTYHSSMMQIRSKWLGSLGTKLVQVIDSSAFQYAYQNARDPAASIGYVACWESDGSAPRNCFSGPGNWNNYKLRYTRAITTSGQTICLEGTDSAEDNIGDVCIGDSGLYHPGEWYNIASLTTGGFAGGFAAFASSNAPAPQDPFSLEVCPVDVPATATATPVALVEPEVIGNCIKYQVVDNVDITWSSSNVWYAKYLESQFINGASFPDIDTPANDVFAVYAGSSGMSSHNNISCSRNGQPFNCVFPNPSMILGSTLLYSYSPNETNTFGLDTLAYNDYDWFVQYVANLEMRSGLYSHTINSTSIDTMFLASHESAEYAYICTQYPLLDPPTMTPTPTNTPTATSTTTPTMTNTPTPTPTPTPVGPSLSCVAQESYTITTTQAADNLIADPDFASGSIQNPPWNWVGFDISIGGYSGSTYAAGSQNDGDYLRGEFATVAGHSYELRFWMEGAIYGDGSTKTVAVDAFDGGTRIAGETFTMEKDGWGEFRVRFRATSNVTRIFFTQSGANNVKLDSLSLTNLTASGRLVLWMQEGQQFEILDNTVHMRLPGGASYPLEPGVYTWNLPAIDANGQRLEYEFMSLSGPARFVRCLGPDQTTPTPLTTSTGECDPCKYLPTIARNTGDQVDASGTQIRLLETIAAGGAGPGAGTVVPTPTPVVVTVIVPTPTPGPTATPTPTPTPVPVQQACQVVWSHQDNLWRMNIDGTDQRQISYADDSYPGSFDIAGDKVYFEAYDTGTPQIYIANLDGSDRVRLTSEGYNTYPRVRGNKIAFQSNRYDGDHIWIMDLDGSNQTKISIWGPNRQPAWMQSGDIVFNCGQGSYYQVCTVDADGTNQTQLTTSASNKMYPTSADRIYYLSGSSLWSVALNGTGEIQEIAEGVGTRPYVSPDGEYVVYVSNNEIYVYNTATSQQQQITNNDDNDGMPVIDCAPVTYGDRDIVLMLQAILERLNQMTVAVSPVISTTNVISISLAQPTATPGIPTLRFAEERYEVHEGSGFVVVRAMLDRPAVTPVGFYVSSGDVSAGAGADYAPVAQAMTIPVGESFAEKVITIVDDAVNERTEEFVVWLSSVSGAIIDDHQAIIEISDDDLWLPTPTMVMTDAVACALPRPTPAWNTSPMPDLSLTLPTWEPLIGLTPTLTVAMTGTVVVTQVATLEAMLTGPMTTIISATEGLDFESGRARGGTFSAYLTPALEWLAILNPLNPGYDEPGTLLWALSPVLRPLVPLVVLVLVLVLGKVVLLMADWVVSVLGVLR